MDLSVVVPVYNGEKTIYELFQRTSQTLNGSFSWEIIFVYDCGKDNSWSVIEDLRSANPDHVKGFKLERNYGQHNAILAALTEAKGDFVITLDEDLQHDPGFIPALVAEQKKEDYDVVYGKFERLQHPGMRIWTSEIIRKVLKIIVTGIYQDYSSFRLMKRSLAGQIAIMKNSYNFIDGYLGWKTDRISSVPVKHYRRADGESSYSYFKLFKHAIFIIIAYSKVKTWLLFLSLFFNLSALVLYFINYTAEHSTVNKIITDFFIIGIILLSLGLFAEIIHYSNLNLNKKISVIK